MRGWWWCSTEDVEEEVTGFKYVRGKEKRKEEGALGTRPRCHTGIRDRRLPIVTQRKGTFTDATSITSVSGAHLRLEVPRLSNLPVGVSRRTAQPEEATSDPASIHQHHAINNPLHPPKTEGPALSTMGFLRIQFLSPGCELKRLCRWW